MSGTVEILSRDAQTETNQHYNKINQGEYIIKSRKILSNGSESPTDEASESPLLKQDTFYVESINKNGPYKSIAALENLDTIEYEEFENEEIETHTSSYRPRTLLEAVDHMFEILEELGERYREWKYGNNGIYRFYCHKYNLTKIEASRPYYTKILSQLSNTETLSIQLLSSHYQKKSDSSVYSSNEVVDRVLCQLDELVSCYCSKSCAFGLSERGSHVCSDFQVNHTSLKWKNPSSTERFLTVVRNQSLERNRLTDKISLVDKTKQINKIKPMDKPQLKKTTETVSEVEKIKVEQTSEKEENREDRCKMKESCFIREMGDYDHCVMEYFSERGIIHNLNYPYRRGEETTYIHSFLRASTCYNCGRFCRCKCQRKIFRTISTTEEDLIDISQFTVSPTASIRTEDSECMERVEEIEKRSMRYVNDVYTKIRRFDNKDQSQKKVGGLEQLDLNTMYWHTIEGTHGRVRFLSKIDYGLESNNSSGGNIDDSSNAIKNNANNTGETNIDTNNEDELESNKDTVKDDKLPGVSEGESEAEERSEGEYDPIQFTAMGGSRIDHSMGSVYYANLFKGSSCKVTIEEIFPIVNNIPFKSVSEEHLKAYQKAEWYQMYKSPWWCQDEKYQDQEFFEKEGSVESYVLNVLEALGYLCNLRYDSRFKVIGVGYHWKKGCYWRYFYVEDSNIWDSFRDSVEYLIMISTLPSEVYLDSKTACWVLSTKAGVKKFPLSPSLLGAYNQLVSHYKGEDKNKEPRGNRRQKLLISAEQNNNNNNANNQKGNSKRRESEDYGVDVFDLAKVGVKECTVADVIDVAMKRKLVSSGDGSTPRRHYIQKATTTTPKVKVKLDPDEIYKGIFISTPKIESGNGNNANNVKGNNSVNYDNATNSNVGNAESQQLTSKDKREDKEVEMKLNNLSVILTYYPDVYTQYNTIIKQANDMKVQVSLLLSDLNSVTSHQNQSQNNNNNTHHNNNSNNNGISNSKEVTVNGNKNKEVKKESENGVVKRKENEEEEEQEVDHLPMFDISYNSSSNSWTCLLEVVPCLVCPLECERNGSCLHYTQGKKLIEMICKRLKPCNIKYTFNPHFTPGNPQIHHGKKSEISIISFSVNQYGHERARMLASQVKAIYKIQALNSMLTTISKNNPPSNAKDDEEEEEELDRSIETELLHNAITTQLTSMISTQSFIANTTSKRRLNNNNIKNTNNNNNSNSNVNNINNNNNNSNNNKNNNTITNNANNAIKTNNTNNGVTNNNTNQQLLNNSSKENGDKEVVKRKYNTINNMYRTLALKDREEDCVCYKYGKALRGSKGEVEVSEIVNYNENLYTFSTMLEIKNVVNTNCKKLNFCERHCCFVTTWKDAIEQVRIMYHQIERFIEEKGFNNLVNKFKTDWPKAVKLHNMYTHSIDATEGARLYAQTNQSLTDCFAILVNLQKIINEALIAAVSLAIRALSDASQEKCLINRLFLLNNNMKVSGETVRNSLLFANEILFPFGALHDEATPPLSDEES